MSKESEMTNDDETAVAAVKVQSRVRGMIGRVGKKKAGPKRFLVHNGPYQALKLFAERRLRDS